MPLRDFVFSAGGVTATHNLDWSNAIVSLLTSRNIRKVVVHRSAYEPDLIAQIPNNPNSPQFFALHSLHDPNRQIKKAKLTISQSGRLVLQVDEDSYVDITKNITAGRELQGSVIIYHSNPAKAAALEKTAILMKIPEKNIIVYVYNDSSPEVLHNEAEALKERLNVTPACVIVTSDPQIKSLGAEVDLTHPTWKLPVPPQISNWTTLYPMTVIFDESKWRAVTHLLAQTGEIYTNASNFRSALQIPRQPQLLN